jgi:hypothetical protein
MAKFAVIAAKFRAAAASSKLRARNRARKIFQVIKLLILWPKKFWIWAWKNFHVIIIFFLVVAPPLTASLCWPDEDIIRRGGLWLQLAGIGTVWWGIEETRKLFGHPPFWQQARQRLRDGWHTFPPLRRGVIVGVGTVGATASSGRGRGFSWDDAPPDATVEQRLEAMEKNITRVRDNLATFADMTEDKFTKQTEALKQEQADRAKINHEIRNLLTTTETGGLHITMIGAFFLFLGVTMSTVPAELADFVFQPVNGMFR